MTPAPRIRVAAYVVRPAPTGPQLLVFDHIDFPEAGTQIPAGGVDPGETPRDAVLREVAEETGLTGLSLIAEIGVDRQPHSVTGQPRHTTYFHLRAPATTPDRWAHTVGGTGEDAALRFACRFVPLPLPTGLADHQGALLHRINPYPSAR